MLSERFLNRSGSLLLLMMGAGSLAALIARTFALQVNVAFPFWLAALCLCQWFGTLGRKRFFLGLLGSLLFLLAAIHFNSEDLRAELADAVNQMQSVYFNYLTGKAEEPPVPACDHTALLLVFLFPVSYYFSQALTAARARIWLVLLVFLPLSLACLAVNGLPNPVTVFFLALFVVLLLVSGSLYAEDSARGGMLWALAVPSALILLLCLTLADPAHYSFDDADIARSRRIDRLTQALSLLVHREPVDPPRETVLPATQRSTLPRIDAGHWSIRREELDMSQGNIGFDDSFVVLQIQADTSECMYLRRCSYGDYAGNRWLLAEDDSDDSALSFAALAASGSAREHSASITLKGSSDLLLVPYFSALSGSNDSYVRAEGQKEYQISYYSVGSDIYSMRLSGEDAERELAYRDYAYSRYTALPETTEFSAKRILEDAGIHPDDANVIWEIASFVQQSGRYDIRTSPYQSSDYAIFFLTQSHRGYCMHFATAAAVLYRAAGIPARLTDGFMVSTKAGETVDVLQGEEHAWVEVYIDGLGWVPVEATGSAGFSSGFGEGEGEEEAYRLPSPFSPGSELWTAPPETPAPTPSPTPRPTPAPTASPAPGDPSLSPSAAPSTAALESPAPSDTPETPSHTQEPPSPWLLLLTLPALAFFVREMLLILRRNAIRQKNRRKAALCLWREAKKLCRNEAKIPREIRSCAERAAFGRSAPSKEELQAARISLKTLEEETGRKAPAFRRLRLALRGRIFK